MSAVTESAPALAAAEQPQFGFDSGSSDAQNPNGVALPAGVDDQNKHTDSIALAASDSAKAQNDASSAANAHHLGLRLSLSPAPKPAAPAETPSSKPLSPPSHADDSTATQPVTQVASGIEPTAPFKPDEQTSELPQPQSHLDQPTTSATVPTHVDQPTSDLRDEVAPQPAMDSGLTQAVEAATLDEPSPAIPKLELESDPKPVASFDAMDTSGPAVATAPTNEPAPVSPESSEPIINTDPAPAEVSNADVDMAGASDIAPVDTEMSEAPEAPAGSGVVRAREEDESEEPSAKRAKIEGESDQAQAEFKVPDLPPINTSAAATPGDNAAGVSPATAATDAVQTPLSALPPSSSDDKDSAKSFDNTPMTNQQKRYLAEQLRKAKKIKFAVHFAKPVDWVSLNIPSYPEMITQPMDLSTIEGKLKEDQYPTVDDLVNDVRLMVNNAVKFNGLQHDVTQAGLNLRSYFYKTLVQLPRKGDAPAETAAPPKKKDQPTRQANQRRESRAPAHSPTTPAAAASPQAFAPRDGVPQIRRNSSVNDGRPKREIHKPPPRDLPYSTARPQKKRSQAELKFCSHVLKEMYKAQYASFVNPFYDPVDPVALNIPSYWQVIKKPMDMHTLSKNLKDKQYSTAKEFKADMELMFQNCYKFNPESDHVHQMGKKTEELFKKLWDEKNDWVRNNQPPSEPSEDEEDEEDEEEDEEEESGGVDTEKLAALQAQMAALHEQMSELVGGGGKKGDKRPSPSAKAGKKGAKKDKKADQGAKAKRGGGGAAAAKQTQKREPKKQKVPKVTQDQKREVSEGIGALDSAGMQRAVQIIRNGVPHLQSVNDDELELDIEEIPNDVVWELYQFVVNPKDSAHNRRRSHKKEPDPQDFDPQDDDFEPHPRQRGGGGAAPGGGRKKNKPMTASEQERKIRELQDKVQSFDQGMPVPGAMGGGSSVEPSPPHDSDDDDEDSESEEE